ncbi:S8 family peptidase [Lentibacillus sp. L22]|uniref:S8 family peptidase n=1 Tax=Lentibacillus TaxID=175304 RepID=UPI0022B0B114|nr:S8 family peptidase [Lentibacillus daqui]
MLGFAMVQLARRMGDKLDRNMRQELVKLCHPFRSIPCFLHRPVEHIRKKTKRLPVVIDFHNQSYQHGLNDFKKITRMSPRPFHSICSCSTKLSIDKLERLLDNCQHIKKIHYDRKMTILLDTASPAIRSNQLQKSGLTGKDITVAVIDTGIHPHQDLKGRIIAFKDLVKNKTKPYDDNGHGTHCAGDVAGDGSASNGKYRGPAPEANLVGVKVLNKKGSGSLSTVIEGIDWCIQNQSRYNINVLSLSLGSKAQQSAENDPAVRVVDKAWNNGIVVCVAAGNEGPEERTISSPGISPKVITVGAVNDNDTIDRSDDVVADFSSRGPTVNGLVKPDLLTPGVNIISLRSPGSYLDRIYFGARVGKNYFSLSGTSMATPIFAGVVAQILQKETNLTPDQVKQKVIQACEDIGQPPNVQGNGYLNAEKLFG